MAPPTSDRDEADGGGEGSSDRTGALRAMLVHQHELIEEAHLARRTLLEEIAERKVVEEKLRASEKFSRTILENSPDCVKLLDGDGHLQFMNTNGLCLLELDTFAQVENRLWWDLWLEESRAVVKEAVVKAGRGDTVHFQAFCPTAKGTPKWWDVIVTAVPGDSGATPRLLSVSRDITASKRAEEALRESEARHEYSLQLSDALRPLSNPVDIQATAGRVLGEYLGVSRVVYFETRSTDYIVARDYVNGAVPLAGAYPMASFGSRLLETYRNGRVVIESDVAQDVSLTPAERAAFAGIQVGAHIGVPLVKDGEFLAGLAVHSRGPRTWTPRDVSLAEETAERTWAAVERARAEQAVRKSEARFGHVFASNMVAMAVWTKAGTIVDANDALLDLIGYTRADLERRQIDWLERTPPEYHERDREAIAEIEAHGFCAPYEKQYRHRDGRRIPILIGGGHFDDRVDAGILFAIDITERKSAEAALRASQDQLQEADRRKDEFLAMLAHELRNPLAPIRTGLELIRLAGNSATSVERVRTMMERQVGHMVRLIDDLLDVSRITSGKIQLQRKPTAPSDVVNSAVEANRGAFEAAQVQLRVHLADQPCLLDVDPTRMVQVISNLLHNAGKFTQPGGHVDVSSRWTLPTGDSEGEFELAVADDGIGISADILPRVFDLFTQGDQRSSGRAQAGLGIGLALARRLVEMHGGRIEATSAGLDQGSTFTLRLPIARALAVADSPQASVSIQSLRRRVVVVDDNEDAAQSMAMLIEELGSETRIAHDGAAGLQAIREFRPDVVVLDIGMPGMDGYETCKRIRAEASGSDLLIVALTGWGQEQDKRRAIDAGFDAHLTKPADPSVLERILAAPTEPRVS